MQSEKRKHPNVSVIGFVVLTLAVVGASVYGYMQIRGLKLRATAVENRVNDVYVADETFEEAAEEKVDIDVISRSTKQLRVEEGYDDNGNPRYEVKNVEQFVIRIKNNTSFQYSDSYAIQAKTEKGVLISPSFVHPDDFRGESSVSLAPGGEAEVTLHFVAPEGVAISDIYTDGFTHI